VCARESCQSEIGCVYGVHSEKNSVCERVRERVSSRGGGSRRNIGSRIASIGSSAGSCVAVQGSGVVRETVFGFWFMFPGFRFQVPVSGFRFQVSGLRSQVPGFRFGVEGGRRIARFGSSAGSCGVGLRSMVQVCISVCMYMLVCVCMYMHVCMCMCMCTCVCVCAWVGGFMRGRVGRWVHMCGSSAGSCRVGLKVQGCRFQGFRSSGVLVSGVQFQGFRVQGCRVQGLRGSGVQGLKVFSVHVFWIQGFRDTGFGF